MIAFFQINLLLVLTYFAFLVAQKMESWFASYSTPKAFLRCAQLLVVLSIVAPLAVKLAPVKRASIELPTFETGESKVGLRTIDPRKKINTFIKEAPIKVQKMEESISFDFRLFVLILWGVGFLFLSSKLIINYFKLRNVLNAAFIMRKVSRLKIVIADNILVPFSVRTFGYYWVVLPQNLLNNKKDFQLAIKHEVQHHKQGDTAWAIFIELLVCIFYFNPVIYLWKNIIIEYQEFSCDEALTGQEGVLSHDYGNCLLRVAETALKNRQMYAGTTCMAVVFKDSEYFKTFLLRRIEMIVKERKSHSMWIPVCTGLMITILTITFAYGVERVTRAQSNSVNSGLLVVDEEIQKIADESLRQALKHTKAVAGFIIVADPVTGKILAVANVDTKQVKKGHWALSQLIEPASFAKTLVIAEAIEKKATSPHEMHKCENGQYNYKGKIYRDWSSKGWEELSTTQALAISSDICSMKIGEKVGDKSLELMVEKFGFGPGGVAQDFPEAKVGESPEMGDHFIPKVTLGYAFKTSPLEIMQAYGAIANGGNLMKPIMANSNDSKVIRRVLSTETAEKMKTVLQEVVISGTAKGRERAESSFYTTAGKTASARLNDYMKIDWYGGDKHANFAGFVGFSPVNKPRVQVFVGLINPNTDKSGAHGGEHASPVFKEVAENVLAFMKVAPDKL